MSIDSTAPETSTSIPGDIGEDARVSLLYMPLGHDPSPLLHIPHDCMKLYSLKPRKWLLYVATHICGIDGRLRLLDKGEDLTGEEMEETVKPGDHYVFCFDGEANFLDWYLRGSRNDRKSSTSTRSRVVPKDLKEFYGGCPFTQEPPDQCDVCHLIPFAKGDDYLHRLLASRGDPDDTMTINDYQNQIVTDVRLHRAFDRNNIAFLNTPNRFLKTNEVPGGENDPLDIYCVTVHCFLESEKRRTHLNHGARSHMKESSGLEHPPAGRRRTVAEYLPKDILLDVTYAYTVLYRFCSTSAREMLEKTTENTHYPDGIVKRGEDREGEAEKKEQKRKRDEDSEKRSERNARRSRTGDDTRDRANEDEGEFDFWDWVLAMQMKIHGVHPEDIEAEEERREKEMEELNAQRIAGWQQTVDESRRDKRDDNIGCSVQNKEGVVSDACDVDDEKPVSIEEALSRSPPPYSVLPTVTYPSSTVW